MYDSPSFGVYEMTFLDADETGDEPTWWLQIRTLTSGSTHPAGASGRSVGSSQGP
jgi:hypothetical protein